MANTASYPIIAPKAGDLIVGTQTFTAADPVTDNPTRNFTVQSIISATIQDGFNMKSANNSVFKITVSNAGVLVVTPV